VERPGGGTVTGADKAGAYAVVEGTHGHPRLRPGAARCLAAGTVPGSGRVRFFGGNPSRADFDRLARHVVEGKLSSAVDTVFPLEETAAAHRAMEEGGARGEYAVKAAQAPRKGAGRSHRSPGFASTSVRLLGCGARRSAAAPCGRE
jgi:hypothetical protein